MSTHAVNMFSLRIVTVDHYLNVPLPDLDPCYSQFRGSQVAKVTEICLIPIVFFSIVWFSAYFPIYI